MTTNYAVLIRRELLMRISKELLQGTLMENIDRLPFAMRPRDRVGVRCCPHKERAVVRYRTMAVMGYNVYDEVDEMTPLSDFARQSLARKEESGIFLTVVDEACSSCVKSKYVVTNLCRGCVGRPCMYACNKNAIQVDETAKIDVAKCVSCGLCLQACPFHAIIYQPVPCEEACPVGALSKDDNGIENIDASKCIYCGRCVMACPFGAIMEKSQLIALFDARQRKEEFVVMLAPALAGQFKAEFGRLITAVQMLGFPHVMEVAEGANVTTANEAAEFQERILEGGEPFMTTSCCPSYVNLVNQHIPELKPFVSHTKSPMAYSAIIAKERFPNAKTVFVAPCVAKRSEAFKDPNVDFVLSVEELASLFMAAEIDVMKCDEATLDPTILNHGRLYPIIGGVAASVQYSLPDPTTMNPILIDGINRASIRQLKAFAKGDCPGNMVEVMSCEGGCVNGCDNITQAKPATRQITNFFKSDKS